MHASLALALVLLLVAALVAAPFAIRRPAVPELPGRPWVWAGGAVLGLLLWRVAGEIGGDGSSISPACASCSTSAASRSRR